jgi:hypothetical protein
MNKITPQSVFNAAWKKFVLEDNPPATEKVDDGDDSYFGCRYLTENGQRCAVGLCIPDDHDCLSSGSPVSVLAHRHDELFEGYYRWNELQADLHDSMIERDTGKWSEDFNSRQKRKDHYAQVAQNHNLTIPE